MRKINEIGKKSLTLLLAFIMVVTLVPLNLFVVAEDSIIGSMVRFVSDSFYMYREAGEYATSYTKDKFPETLIILDVQTVVTDSLTKTYYKLGTVDGSSHSILNTYCWTEDYNVEIIDGNEPLTLDDMQVGVLYKAKFEYDAVMPLARSPFVSTYDDYEDGLLDDYAIELESIPATLTVVRMSEQDLNYVYIKSQWPEEYSSYRYVEDYNLSIVDGEGTAVSADDMEIGVTYYATWNLLGNVNSISPLRKVTDESESNNYVQYSDEYVEVTDEFPTELIVKLNYEGDDAIYVTNTDWPSWLENYRYFDIYDPETDWGDIVVTGVYNPATPDEDGLVYGQVDLTVDGKTVTELVIEPGEKIYVFPTLGNAVSDAVMYRWQMLVDKENDRWADIANYYYPHVTVSEALIENARDDDGKAALRCIVIDGDIRYASGIITISKEQTTATLQQTFGPEAAETDYTPEYISTKKNAKSGVVAAADEPLEFQIAINYHYLHTKPADADLLPETAAETNTIHVPADSSYTGNIISPQVKGYKPFLLVKELDESRESYYIHVDEDTKYQPGTTYDGVTITYDGLQYNPAPAIYFDHQSKPCTVDVYYIPQEVNFSVKYYEQNLYDDEYLLVETKVFNIDKTVGVDGYEVGKWVADGKVGAGLDFDRPGFKSLYYDVNTRIDASGKTVIDIYYDRIYYLVEFDLTAQDGSEGFGAPPVYVRHGTPVTLDKPTNPGYTFLAWELGEVSKVIVEKDSDGKATEKKETVTDKDIKAIYDVKNAGNTIVVKHNLKYKANWQETQVSYAIIYWKENANDNGYSCWGVQTVTGHRPGEEVTVDGTNIPQSIHKGEKNYFTYNSVLSDTKVTVKGDGSAVANVYYYRNIYTLTFQANGLCNIPAGHTHTDACYDYICGSSNHVHDENCILTCTTDPHTHEPDCCSVTPHTHSSACCSIQEHTHGQGDCACKLEEHTHSLSCYTTQTPTKVSDLGYYNYYESRAHNALLQRVSTPTNGYVYSYSYNTGTDWWPSYTTYNYFYFNGTWYYLNTGTNYAGINVNLNNPGNNNFTSGAASTRCNKTEHTHGINCNCDQVAHDHTSGCNIESCTNGGVEHTHGDGNCNYTCEKTAHVHDASCYDCGEDPHEHTDACKRLICGIPLNHTHSGNCDSTRESSTVAIITGKYGSDIREKFPIKGLNDASFAGYWWLVPNQSIFLAGGKYIVSLDQIPGEDLTFKGTSKGTNAVIYYYVEALPGSPYVDDLPNGGNRHYELYKEVITAREGYFTEKEEFHAIEGFTSGYSKGLYYPNTIFSKEVAAENYLYYTRNSHTLQFHSNNVHLTDLDQTVLYGSSMSSYASAVPTYPSTFEPNAYKFAGWYTTSGCYEGTEYDFATETMPDQNVLLYAKWVPTEWNFKVYLDKDHITEAPEKTLVNETVSFDFSPKSLEPNYAKEQEKYPNLKEQIFAGWYYTDSEGKEVRFDFKTMSIKTNYNGEINPETGKPFNSPIYAKWTSIYPVKYTIYYVLTDADGNRVKDSLGNDIHVADPTVGVSLVNINKSFTAKAGQELYAEYRTGYFPHERTTVHTMQSEGGNIIYFEYKTMEKFSYRVTHIFKDSALKDVLGTTDTLVIFKDYEVSAPASHSALISVEFRELITEALIRAEIQRQYPHLDVDTVWAEVSKLSPDAYNKEFILVASKNIEDNTLIFNWSNRGNDIVYEIVYKIQNLGSTDPTDKNQYSTHHITYDEDMIGLKVSVPGYDSADPTKSVFETIVGYTPYVVKYGKTGDPSNYTVTLFDPLAGAGSVTMYVYYVRNSYQYTVRHLEIGTYKELAPAETGYAEYQATITKNAKTDLTGYRATNSIESIQISDNEMANEIVFLYEADIITYYYKVGEGLGSLSSVNESVKVGTTIKGTTVTPRPGYIFEGWYRDEECTQKVDPDWVDGSALKPDNLIGEVTTDVYFYAKFVPTSLTIQNSFSAVVNPHPALDIAEQGFIYSITGAEDSNRGITTRVAVVGYASKAIMGLPIGEYTVTVESAWSWRYDSISGVTIGDRDPLAFSGMTWTIYFDGSDIMVVTYGIPGPDVSGTTENNSYYFITDNATN